MRMQRQLRDAAGALVLLLLAARVEGGTAVRLGVSAPCVGVCPGPAFYSTVVQGIPVTVVVVAIDAGGMIDTSYAGTVRFSSSDSAASLSPQTSFSSGDQGSHTFVNGVVLRTSGLQTITVTDVGAAGVSGTLTLTVVAAPPAEPIPMLSMPGAVLCVVWLSLLGLWLMRRQS